MSIFAYTLSPEDYTEHVNAIEPHAINHSEHCPHGGKGRPDTSRHELTPECCRESGNGKYPCRVGYMVEQYRGHVVRTYERNGYDDSDFYATVGFKDGSTVEIQYATTRGWTYFHSATVDATEEIVKAVTARKEEKEKQRAKEVAEHKAKIEATMPREGKTVKVKSKRSKLPYGTTGKVAWFGVSRYANQHYAKYENPYAGLVSGLPAELRRFESRPGDFAVGLRLNGNPKLQYISASCVEIVERS